MIDHNTNSILLTLFKISATIFFLLFAIYKANKLFGVKGKLIALILSLIIIAIIGGLEMYFKFDPLPPIIAIGLLSFSIPTIIVIIKSEPIVKENVEKTLKNVEKTEIIEIKEMPDELLALFHTFFVSNGYLADQNMPYKVFAEIFLKQKLYTVLNTSELRTLFNIFSRSIQTDMDSENWLRYFYRVEKGKLDDFTEALAPKGLKLYSGAKLFALDTFQKAKNPDLKKMNNIFKDFEKKVLEILKKSR